jgi:hypothetical protein
MKELVDTLDASLETDLKAANSQLLESMYLLAEKLRRLKAGNNLSEEERIERDILMLTRAMQQQELKLDATKLMN